MKTLNLVYPEKSEIKYEIQRFPDGQQNVVIPVNFGGKFVDTGFPVARQDNKYHPSVYIFPKSPTQIQSRLNNWTDLELTTLEEIRKRLNT